MSHRFRRKRNNSSLPEITLTPLIDTVLVLLIIFMMSMPVLHNYLNVALPQANNSDSQQTAEPVNVHIDEKKQYYVNGSTVSESQLVDTIRTALEKTQDKGIIVYADQQLSYGTVVIVLDEMKAIDAASYVSLAVEPRQ